ncbi:hypothetical protein ACFQPA_04570 [Halomarina halobia]|uniref:Uncharacterized protein n=1 Tax=Halomarina halobia TaxID=3033386 RepID=A0ABD6A5S6_9EURY|nr:hypothetical protein [Halomarina sp. PSR21]
MRRPDDGNALGTDDGHEDVLAPGLALPEVVGAVALGAWTATTAFAVRRR